MEEDVEMSLALTILAYLIGLPIAVILWKIAFAQGLNININYR